MVTQWFRNSNPSVVALRIGVTLFFVYMVNLSFLAHGDPVPGAMTALSLVREGNFDLNEFAGTELGKALAWKEPTKLPYYAIQSRVPGKIVSVFGFGHSLVAAPVFFLANMLVENWSTVILGFVAKTAASVIAGAAGGVMYLVLLSICADAGLALTFAFLFGLGTCVWSISSHGLWQHGPIELALACGLLAIQKKKWTWLGF
ncbi:MAG: hypothetical protein AAB425_13220, partial [Bdellovibrionota bacterium]